MDTKLIVSASPHLRSEETTTGLMANVIVALVPLRGGLCHHFWSACSAGHGRVRRCQRGL